MRSLICSFVLSLMFASHIPASGQIYGTVTTHDGVFTGPIRWDKNENFWDDLLNAQKEGMRVRKQKNSQEVSIFGFTIRHSGDSNWSHRQFTIPFGHLDAIDPGRNETRLLLKGGGGIVVDSESDLGSGMRGVVVEDPMYGTVEMDWSDIEHVDFHADPNPEGKNNDRLYGVVKTRDATIEGFIVWDRDESLTTDILDGDSRGRGRKRSHKIPFGNIASIERRGRDACQVTLKNGDDLVLRGTNDVDSGNRGIDVTGAEVGTIQIPWRAFESVDFKPAPPSRAYSAFDGGREIYGTVYTDDGETFTGRIAWDQDERYTWEALDGDIGDLGFRVEFENIAQIEKTSRDGARVTLTNGNTLDLEDSNDVTEENEGIVVYTENGDEVIVLWRAFSRLELHPKPAATAGSQ